MPFHKQAPVQFSEPVLSFVESERDRYRAAALARHTHSSYERDLRIYRAWCDACRRQYLPTTSETLELYIADMLHRGRKVTTVQRHVAGIQHAHRVLGFLNPCTPETRAVLLGAKRLLCQAPTQKTALTVADLRKMVATSGEEETAIQGRNRALLLFGFATALRRSTLAALDLQDMKFKPLGVTAFIRHEKQDTTGEGRMVTIPFAKDQELCPVHALNRWISRRGYVDGPLFQQVRNGSPNGQRLKDSRIAVIVKDSVARIGLDPHSYSGHSLRAGFITEAILAGVSDHEIMEHTGHRSLEMLRQYFRPVYSFRAHPCHRIGL
jgi:site-specific recombinase XerD